MAKQTYWFDGRQIPEDDAFDSNGVMRDGVGMRVGTMMRDGVEVAEGIMMYDEPVPLGDSTDDFLTDSEGRALVDAFGAPLSTHYGRKGYAFMDADRSVREQNYQLRKAQLSSAWRGGLTLGDEVIIDGERMRVAGNNRENNKPILGDADTVDAAERAYDEYKKHISGAWKKQKEPKEREWEIAGPLSDSQRDEVKEAAWRDSVADLENAWRK